MARSKRMPLLERPALLLLLLPLQLAAKGCDVATVGEDPPAQAACGGLQGLACAEGQYCDYAPDARCGAAGASGLCQPMPEVCPEEYAPVCGCDNITYGHACFAHMMGVSVASEGRCEQSGSGSCGGLQGLACADGEFCDYAPGDHCGAADATGVCTPVPQGCDDNLLPVCGCDDKTYSNACEANRVGVSVAYEGECGSPDPSGTTCGGFSGEACAEDEFCNFAPGDQCGAADATGTCTPKPEACDAILDLVCGCNGLTYQNECLAWMAGVSVASPGECL